MGRFSFGSVSDMLQEETQYFQNLTQIFIDNTFYNVMHSGPIGKWYNQGYLDPEMTDIDNFTDWDFDKQQILINYSGQKMFVNSNTLNNEEMH